jgi:hypothetical protein
MTYMGLVIDNQVMDSLSLEDVDNMSIFEPVIYNKKCYNSLLQVYQENWRIYLDEYEVEEVDLRVNFDTSLLMKRFMVKE